jgi:hypothetical protein
LANFILRMQTIGRGRLKRSKATGRASKRGRARNAVQAAAYRSGSRLVDEKCLTPDLNQPKGVLAIGAIAAIDPMDGGRWGRRKVERGIAGFPEQALPQEVREGKPTRESYWVAGRAAFWADALEADREERKSAYGLVISLPVSLTLKEHRALARRLATEMAARVGAPLEWELGRGPGSASRTDREVRLLVFPRELDQYGRFAEHIEDMPQRIESVCRRKRYSQYVYRPPKARLSVRSGRNSQPLDPSRWARCRVERMLIGVADGMDRTELWRRAAVAEPDGQNGCHELIVTLPTELSMDRQREAAYRLARELHDRLGIPVECEIGRVKHPAGSTRREARLLYATREFDEAGAFCLPVAALATREGEAKMIKSFRQRAQGLMTQALANARCAPRTFDYRRKAPEVRGSGIIGFPTRDTLNQQRQDLWNAAERYARRDGIVGREIVISLPRELSEAAQIRTAEEIARTLHQETGCAVDWNRHVPARPRGKEHPHVHIMLTAQPVAPATGAFLPRHGRDSISGKYLPELRGLDHALAGSIFLDAFRARAARIINRALAAEGETARVDSRSLAERGILRLPVPHVGPVAKNRRSAYGRDLLEGGPHSMPRTQNAKRLLEHERVTKLNNRLLVTQYRLNEIELAFLDRSLSLTDCLKHRHADGAPLSPELARMAEQAMKMRRWMRSVLPPTYRMPWEPESLALMGSGASGGTDGSGHVRLGRWGMRKREAPFRT